MTKYTAHTGEETGAAPEKDGLREEAVPNPEAVSGSPEGEAGEDAPVSPAGDGPGEAGAESGPDERISLLEDEIAALKDQYLRKAAEFENFRKRMIREKQDSIDFANQSLLLDLVQIIDDFERALKAGEAFAAPEGEAGRAAGGPAASAEAGLEAGAAAPAPPAASTEAGTGAGASGGGKPPGLRGSTRGSA
jgi:hypothetical protein